jgi:hypothetical protein
MPATSIVAKGSFSETVTYLGWAIFVMECSLLRISVTLPRRAKLIESVPGAANSTVAKGITIVTYERDTLRPRESYFVLIGYKRMKLGASAIGWLAGAVGTGLIGAIVAAAIGLN